MNIDSQSDSSKPNLTFALLASMSVEEEPSEETVESIRKQVTFCEEGMIAEPLGPSWKAEGTKVKQLWHYVHLFRRIFCLYVYS